MPDAAKVGTTRTELKENAGPSGFGSATHEERTLAAADAGTTYGGWRTGTRAGPTGVTGRGGATGPAGAAGATGPAGA